MSLDGVGNPILTVLSPNLNPFLSEIPNVAISFYMTVKGTYYM